jgi:nitrite reductase/ring-hydroxylating ferredoxin subunit
MTKRTTKRERELELSKRKTKRNRLVIMSAVVVAIVGIGIYFAMFGGSDGGNHNTGPIQNNGPITATWIDPQVVADTVSIPVSEVEDNRNVHFEVETQDSNMNFMAYVLDGETHVRANVCPPCRSIGFSLDQHILVCDRCATTFSGETGQGIEGACVDYPKASVPYQLSGGNIVMNSADLMAAYEDTIEPGWL